MKVKTQRLGHVGLGRIPIEPPLSISKRLGFREDRF